MRVVTETDKTSYFANWLLEIGNKNFTSEQNNMIALPAYENINCNVLNMFPGKKHMYLSADEAIIEDGANNHNVYPTEYLNTLNPSRMPPSKLKLKIVVNRLTNHIIEALILCGEHAEKTVFIPCITLTPLSTNLLFIFKQRQFPIHNAFAITINKSQGQSLMHVELDL
ncbi:30842_t:CDS:2 [Gigaspora margarita]|uniref:30842_t:CDS:1 n=1 Tax=Gigaspora margarita TaxID=4874 RepID=A0ABN7UBZ5_GIGMA|nr:30842_t:CDS:2 [Gigaspora margarita]